MSRRLFAFCVAAMLVSTTAVAEISVIVDDDTIYYDGRLEHLPGTPRFTFYIENKRILFPPRNSAVRLWGVEKVTEDIPVSILSEVWKCRVVGRPLEDLENDALPFICERDGQNLAGVAIRLGYATEDCGESLNFFGTCSVKESDE
jgi:hypothetical protein